MNLFIENENNIIFSFQEGYMDLEKFLESKDISGRLFRRLYKEKQIFVNGEFQRKGLELNPGDIVTLHMADEFEEISPEPMDLDIVYEDIDLLILNKPFNKVVHPTKSHQTNTLSNGIANYFLEKNIKKKIRFVNRLDMDTTGLLIIAKNSFAHQQMGIQFENNTVVKKYLTLVKGIMEKDSGIIDVPIGREEDKSIKKVVCEQGQEALTSFKVIERFTSSTLVEVQIHTGRSHQIRVHLNHLGHPVIGDTLYGEASPFISRQALHSHYLKAIHPRNKKEIEFIANMPQDMINLINHMK